MDPTISLIQYPQPDQAIQLDVYQAPIITNFKLNLSSQALDRYPDLYVEVKAYQQLQQLKDRYADKGATLLARQLDPYRISHLPFINRAATKLAALDALYDLTKDQGFLSTYQAKPQLERLDQGLAIQEQSLSRQLSTEPPVTFTFADVAGGPGSFSQYLFFKQPLASGIGITLANDIDWHPKILAKVPTDQLAIYRGPDLTGDVIKHSDDFIKTSLARYPQGVDLVVADGSIETNETDPNQELANARLFLHELYVGLSIVKVGGDLVCKFYEAHGPLMAQLIFIMATTAKYCDIMKPLSSRPANAERYLVLKQIERKTAALQVLETAVKHLQERPGYHLTNLLAEPLPDNYVTWLTNKNNQAVAIQLAMVERVIAKLDKQALPTPPSYFQHIQPERALTLWHLPDHA